MSAAEMVALFYVAGCFVSWPFLARAWWKSEPSFRDDVDRVGVALTTLLFSSLWFPLVVGMGFRRAVRWWLP